MSYSSWQEVITSSIVDGPTLTAAARASAIPPANVFPLRSGFFVPGKMIKITAQGRLTTAGTPGTGRWDVSFGSTANLDSTAFNMKASVTTVPWWLEIVGTCRTAGSGSAGTIMWFGQFSSEAVIGSAAPTAGGNGCLTFTHGAFGAPVVGAGFDSTAAIALDLRWTPSLGTASLICHQYKVEELN